MERSNRKRDFFIRIILPTLLVFVLFTISIFTIIIPQFEKNIMDRKREMIREITASAWSILEEYHEKAADGLLSDSTAKAEAITNIHYLRYGAERKDYFWLTDMRPFMIMHPYRPELNNTSLTEYRDPTGKKLFVEVVNEINRGGEGFVDYMWQWKDDSTRIVPKLSYVKGFEPWGWIIGTGIYIQDVKAEINLLTRNLIYISLGILSVLALILFYVSRQSLRIEQSRRKAESGLRESEAKYRALVEASTEGLVMMLDGDFIYANKALMNMLGYDEREAGLENLPEILCVGEENGAAYIQSLKNGSPPVTQLEARLPAKNGEMLNVILFTSEITFGEKSGYTIIIKDVSVHKKIEDELGESRAQFQSLLENIRLGLFRLSAGNYKIVESNSAAAVILGFADKQELSGSNIFDYFIDKSDQKLLLKTANENKEIRNQIFQIRKKDGARSTISISLKKTADGAYFDGMIEDITESIKLTNERENLIVELQTSLRFLNEPVAHFLKKIVSCSMNESIAKTARLMAKRRYSATLLTTENNEFIGMVTDHDLRERVAAENYNLSRPAYEIMSSPVISINANALVFHALLFMHEKSVRHLAVKNGEGRVIGIISSEELLKVHHHSASYLLHEIENAASVDELVISRERLPRLVKTLVISGAKTKNITQIITSIFDAIAVKLIGFAIEELGPPPAEFSFIALGSAGRRELTLISDQDNAIIFEDVPAEDEPAVQNYFQKLADFLCDGLNVCGYVYCKGEAMAKNPKWTQSLAQWEKYFHNWITQSEPQDLIDLSIFFDFRNVYGSHKLTNALRSYLLDTAEGQSGFLRHLAQNCLSHKPPVGLLGKIVVESGGEHPETFDLKAASMPLTDFARLHALREKISHTSSLDRFAAIQEKGIINKGTFDELVEAYNFLMQLRFKHHISQMDAGADQDNYVNPDQLTQIERNTLKNTFSQISSIQKKLNYEFSGEAL